MAVSGQGQLIALPVAIGVVAVPEGKEHRLNRLVQPIEVTVEKDFLEGNVVVGDADVGVVRWIGGSALIVAGAAGFRVATGRSAFTAGFASEQGEFVAEDLGLVFLFAAGLVVPGAGLNLAFDQELSAFFNVVANDFGSALEADDVVPLGLVGPVSLSIFLPVGGGEREAGDGHAAGGGTNLGVFADVAEKKDFVDAFCHFDAPVSCRFLKVEDSR